MNTWKGKNVLITGASSGIGAALAREFASQGANVVLTARRLSKLEALAQELEALGVRALPIACDVTQDDDFPKAMDIIHKELGLLDVVIANAGFGVAGAFEKLTVEDYKRQDETNVYGLMRTLYATLDDLKQTKGRAALVGSVMSYLSLPGNTAYSISKYAVRALAEGLYYEWKEHGVSVTLISPGLVASEIRQVDNHGQLKEDAKDPFPSWIVLPAETAAKQIAHAVYKRKRERVITWHGRFLKFLRNHTPFLFWFLMRFVSTSKKKGDAQ